MSLVVTDTNWAVHEFADADLGDERRTTRLVELASALGQHPTAALPEACGTGSMLKAAYRFFDNDGIAPQDILQSHVEATYTRLGAVPVVLAVQDTTEVNWTRHPATQGLGPLGHTACHGLLLHTTLAITPERVPLGLLAQQVWARDPADVGKRARRKQLPISQKESQKWLLSLDAVYTAHDCCPTTRLVSVGDREADVYDVLAAPRPAGAAGGPRRDIGAAVLRLDAAASPSSPARRLAGGHAVGRARPGSRAGSGRHAHRVAVVDHRRGRHGRRRYPMRAVVFLSLGH